MKKTARGCFTIAAVFTVIVAMLASIGRLQTENVRERPPLERQELERLAQEWQKGKPSAEQPETTPIDMDRPPAETSQPPHDLPRRLNRAATNAERREFFIRNAAEKAFAIAACSPLGDAAYAVFAVAEPVNIYWERAEVNLIRGNWDVARMCLSEYIRQCKSPSMIQSACRQLAWLEDDPELAARYMELACAESRPTILIHCAWLAEKTGSTELAERYRARAKAAEAELAEQEKRP